MCADRERASPIATGTRRKHGTGLPSVSRWVSQQQEQLYRTVEVVSQEEFAHRRGTDVGGAKEQAPPPPPPPCMPLEEEDGVEPDTPRSTVSGSGRTPRSRKDNRVAPRFYPVVKEGSRPLDQQTPRKQKTRHSSNPPVEHHVGWVLDIREHQPRSRTTSLRWVSDCTEDKALSKDGFCMTSVTGPLYKTCLVCRLPFVRRSSFRNFVFCNV